MRISVTTIEQFRKYMEGICYCKDECKCLQDLEAGIRGAFIWRPAMVIGSRLHAAIEGVPFDIAKFRIDLRRSGLDESEFAEVLDYDIDDSSLQEALSEADGGRVVDAMQAGDFSQEAKFSYQVEDMKIIGKYDGQTGHRVYDWKTTFKQEADYTRSLQWRYTLAALDARWFCYETFKLSEPRKQAEKGVYIVSHAGSQEYTSYPRIHDDCRRWAIEFRDFVTKRGLTEKLQDRPGDEFPG